MAKEQVEKKVTQAELRKAWWTWMFFSLSAFSMERMQSMAFVAMLSDLIKKFYGDDEVEFKAALKRHMVFFNTEPQTGVIAHGVAIALEEQRANGAPITDDMINAVKAGIMGPMAGIGDAMIPGTLIPILLAIGMGISKDNGSALGPIFYAVAYLAIILPLSWYLFKFGYTYGMNAMKELAAGGFRRATGSLAILGLVVAGGLGASYIALKTPLQIENVLVVQNQLDSIFPTLLPLLLTIWLWSGMRKGWSINRALGMVFLVIFIGFLPGLLGSIFHLDWLTALRIF